MLDGGSSGAGGGDGRRGLAAPDVAAAAEFTDMTAGDFATFRGKVIEGVTKTLVRSQIPATPSKAMCSRSAVTPCNTASNGSFTGQRWGDHSECVSACQR